VNLVFIKLAETGGGECRQGARYTSALPARPRLDPHGALPTHPVSDPQHMALPDMYQRCVLPPTALPAPPPASPEQPLAARLNAVGLFKGEQNPVSIRC